MYKKVPIVFIIVIMLFIGGVSVSSAQDDVKVIVGDKEVKFDVPPQIQKGRTLVPLRAIFEAIGAQVNWDGDTGTITASKEGTTIILKLTSSEAKVNDKTIPLDAPAVSINGRTLVPTRLIAESLGMNVKWDGASRRIFINSKNDFVVKTTKEFYKCK